MGRGRRRVPGRGEALVPADGGGANFIDIYDERVCTRANCRPELGKEAAGVVEAVGRRACGFKVGDRVAYRCSFRAYAQQLTCRVRELCRASGRVSDRLAAAALLKGMTAQVLLRRTYKVGRDSWSWSTRPRRRRQPRWCNGHVILGAHRDRSRWQRDEGGGSECAGRKHVLVNDGQSISADRVKELSDGVGAHVVYDSVGKDTFFASLDCAAAARADGDASATPRVRCHRSLRSNSRDAGHCS